MGVDVPIEVRRKAATQGEPGRRWLARLPTVVAELEREWDVTVGRTLPGGSDSYIAEATTGDGELAVLKVALPGEWVTHQIDTLRHAAGQGYVRLLRHDAARQAMLLERLGAPLAELGLPVAAQLEILCATLRRAWEVTPEPAFQSGADKTAALAAFIANTWETLGRPCPEAVIEQALAYAEARRRAFDPDAAVLVHGDAHAANALVVPGGAQAFKLVDPDGLFAEPACDLAVPMREYSGELLAAPDPVAAAHERCALLSRLTGVEARPIWEWGYLERVSTGLLVLQVRRERLGAEMLAVAAALT